MSLVSGTSLPDPLSACPGRGPRIRPRLSILLAASLSLILVGNAVAQSPAPAASPVPTPALPTLEGTFWVLNSAGATPLVGSANLLLQDGVATGNDGCNDYFAPYTVTGSVLTFGQVGVTFPPLTCTEEIFLTSMAQVTRWRINDNGRMILSGPTGAPILTYSPLPK